MPPISLALLIASYGVFAGTGILSYAVMAEYFPTHMIGRAHSTLTLVLFILIFGLQVGIGAMLSRWPAQGLSRGNAFERVGRIDRAANCQRHLVCPASRVLEKRGGVAS